MGTVAGMINLHTLCYRTQRAKCLDPREADRRTLWFSWHYILPFSILIAYNIPNQDHATVHLDTKSQHPEYHLEIYRNFGGVANAHTLSANYIMLSLSLCTFYVPIIGGYWKTVAMKKLKSNFSSVVSSQNRRLFEALIKIMGAVTGLINLHTLFYRTQRAKCLDTREANRKTRWFSWHYLIPFSVLVIYNIPQQDQALAHIETISEHPGYNYEIYENFGGVANSRSFFANYIVITLSLTTLYVPIIGGYWKTVAMKKLKSNFSTTTSDQNRKMFEALIKGLNLQVLLPLVCYGPVSFLYAWNKYSNEQILFSQYTLAFLVSLPCVFDPMLQMFFIIPYRTAISNVVARKWNVVFSH